MHVCSLRMLKDTSCVLFDNARGVDVLLYLILLINKARLSKIP